MKTTIITGNIGNIQPIRYSKEHLAILSFSVGVYDGKDSQGNSKTLWFNCTLFGKQAENVVAKLNKGDKVLCKGDITLEEYQAKDGTNKSSLKLKVDGIEVFSTQANIKTNYGSLESDDVPF